MNNAQKAIMIGVGLFITIIIISGVLLITNKSSSIIKKSTSEIAVMTDGMQTQFKKEFDRKVLKGFEVLAVIDKYYYSKEVSVIIETTSTTCWVGAKYINAGGAKAGPSHWGIIPVTTVDVYLITGNLWDFDSYYKRTPKANFKDMTNAAYVNSSSYFKSSIIRYGSTNGNIIGIGFSKIYGT